MREGVGIVGGIGETRKQSRLKQSQVPGALPEIYLRRLFHTISTATKIYLVAIGFKNLVFIESRLKLEGNQKLLDLTHPVSLKRKKQVFGKLLGNRASPLGNPLLTKVGP